MTTTAPRVLPKARLPSGVRGTELELAGLALMAVMLPARQVWVVSFVLLGLSLTLPGVLALRAMRVSGSAIARYPLYIPAASLAVLMAAGLGVDLLGPLVGIDRPLSGDASALATIAVSLALWVAGMGAGAEQRVSWRPLLEAPGALLYLALPALTAIGALLLSNGHGSAVSALGAIAIPLVLLFTCLRARRLGTTRVAILLFSCALAAEWAFSLPSQEVVGFDISSELHVAQLTNANGVWHSVHRGDPYSAMLSLTVLPSVLKSLTGISPLILFKAVYPAFTALLPVSIFLIGTRFLRRPYAAGAAAILVAQSYFVQQLPELARQEIGLLFFATLIAALLEDRARRGARYGLIVMFSVGLVVSHYSSTYVAIAILPIAALIEVIVSRRRALTRMVVPAMVAFVVLAAGAGVWYGAVTHSASNLSGFKSSLLKEGLNLLPSSSGGLINSYLNGNEAVSVTGQKYQQLAVQSFKGRSRYIHPLAAASSPRYALKTTQVPSPPVRLAPLAHGFTVLNTLLDELVLVLSVIGSLLAIRSRDRGLRNLAVLASGTIGMLILFRFSGTLGAAYNQTRALLQAWLLLAIPAAYLLQRVAQSISRRLPSTVVATGIAVALAAAMPFMFAYGNGTLLLITGGGRPLNLSQSGNDFETFYQYPGEMTAATWVSAESGGKLIYTDRYGQLRLSATSGVAALQQLTPRTLDAHAWVYGTHTNVVLGRAHGVLQDYTAIYKWPNAFLNNYFDTVFNDGVSKVYHR